MRLAALSAGQPWALLIVVLLAERALAALAAVCLVGVRWLRPA